MGYRSDVRSIIYGDPDKVDVLVAKYQLLSRSDDSIFEDVRVYDIRRQGAQITNPAEMQPGPVEHEVIVQRCIDLDGQDWKWYDDYPSVKQWNAMLAEAAEMELNTEFIRIGEETEDIVIERNLPDEGDDLICVDRMIHSDIDEIIVSEVNKDG
jgi:hypothetical protein